MEIKSSKMIERLTIYDLSGRIIKTISYQGNFYTIDMESVDPGFYILVAVYPDRTKSVKKIVKQ